MFSLLNVFIFVFLLVQIVFRFFDYQNWNARVAAVSSQLHVLVFASYPYKL